MRPVGQVTRLLSRRTLKCAKFAYLPINHFPVVYLGLGFPAVGSLASLAVNVGQVVGHEKRGYMQVVDSHGLRE